MNPPPPPHMISQPPQQRMNPPPPPSQVMNPVQPRIMNQAPLLGQSQGLNYPIIGNQQQQVMMNHGNYNPNHHNLSTEYQNQPNNFGQKHSKMYRGNNWKGKKIPTEQRPNRRMHNSSVPMYNPQQLPSSGGGGGYRPPSLNELQSQNRLKTKKFYPKKKYSNRHVPYAPRNTSSFIIRAKKSGGIAELVSPCPVTPAVLPTPMFSPSREVLGDMAKEEWGVDGYGSMKGLIRLRSEGNDLGAYNEDDEDEEGSSDSDVEEHVEVERRLDQDLSRFEMIYPNYGGTEYNNVLENRVDDQDSHIAQLEEENLTLKERLFLMEREMADMRRRLQYLEKKNMDDEEEANDDFVENESESDGDDTGGSDTRADGDTKGDDVAAENICMQDVEKRDMDEKKENKHMVSVGSNGENKTEKDSLEIAGEQCEDESKENEMAYEKLEDESKNDSVGEQGTTI